MTNTSAFDASLVDFGLSPDEGLRVFVVCGDEGVDVLPELGHGGEGCAGEGLGLQDGEPDLDLVEPGGAGGREVKAHLGMALEPILVLLVGVEVVQDDMEFLIRMSGDDLVHEVEELHAPSALGMGGRHPSGGDVEGGEQGGRAVALVVMAVAGQGPTIGELQIALRPLQSLDRGLLVGLSGILCARP